MTLQQKAQEYVEASGLSLKTDKGEQAYNAYIAGAKENMEKFWMHLFEPKGDYVWIGEGDNPFLKIAKETVEAYLKQKENEGDN